MAARLRALGDNGIDAGRSGALRPGDRLDLGEGQHPLRLGGGHIGGGVGEGVVDGGHACVEGDLDEVIEMGEMRR